MNNWRKYVQEQLVKLGYQLNKRDAMHSGRVRRMLLLKNFAVDTVLDVGANVGQYARELRRDQYGGRIISFEPLGDAFDVLSGYANRDYQWEAYNYALGDSSGRAVINVSSNSEWSSLLSISPEFSDAPPGAQVVREQEIGVRALDDVFTDLVGPNARPFLKIDAQGYEKKVLDGASNSLNHILGIQLEMSLQRAYEGEVLFSDMIHIMEKAGFALMSVEPVNVNPVAGRVRQVDGVFFRPDSGPNL